MNARYPEFVVAGTPREMGNQLGEAARELLLGFVDLATEQVCDFWSGPLESIYDCARASAALVYRATPLLMEEIEGVADAAGLKVEQVMLLQIRNQLEASAQGGCTSVGMQGPNQGKAINLIGQNWDNDPKLDPYTIVLTRRPTTGRAILTVGQVGLIGYIGVSQSGVAMCLNSLPAPAKSVGVPHYFLVRELFSCQSMGEGLAMLKRRPRALPANLMVATPDAVADIELTNDSLQVLPTDRDGFVAHSNHCVHPDLAAINRTFPELIDSYARKRRVNALATVQADQGVDGIKSMLSDHQGFPRSICRHSNDDPKHGHWKTVFSVVIEALEGRMWISRGNPCETAFEVYELQDA